MQAPDLSSEIVAYKCLAIAGGRLWSFHDRRFSWHPGAWTLAWCKRAESDTHGPVPGERCSCGIYAVDSLTKLRTLHYNFPGVAVVELGLAGDVIVGGHGYRAAMARVRRIWTGFSDYRRGRELAEIYNVPVDLMNIDELREPDGHRP